MKLCNAYRIWLKKQHQLGGKEGTGAIQGLVLQTKSSSKSETIEIQESKGPSCWICLEAGPDESGEPLRRDCSCRGESGFAHLYCMVKYAEHKQNDQADNVLNQAWYKCPNCWQRYENELAVDLTTKSVAFVEKEYSGNQDILLEALSWKLDTLVNTKRKEAEEAANEVIPIIGRLGSSNENAVVSIKFLATAAAAYNSLGRLALEKGTRDSAKSALAYFEKARDLSSVLGHNECVMITEANIAAAKSKSGDGTNVSIGEKLKQRHEWYEYCVKKYGEEHSKTIEPGMNFAYALLDANQGIETQRLVEKVSIISERVLGPNHKLSQESHTLLNFIKVRRVYVNLGDECLPYQALQYAEGGAKCIVQGPVSHPRNVEEEANLTLASKDIFPVLGTPVVCIGVETLPHLNGKIGDLISGDKVTDCYEVRFDDKDLESCMVKRDNILILFELPDE